MSVLRKSSRIRKTIMQIDQNVQSDSDEDFVTPKINKPTKRSSNKRPSTDDHDEHETITPNKRQKNKTTTAKTSPYFNTKSTEKKPKRETKSKTKKNVDKPIKNSTISNEATIETSMVIDKNNSDSDDDDDDEWHDVPSKSNEETIILKLLKEREEQQAPKNTNNEIEIHLTKDDVAAAQGKRKKATNSREHQLELALKRVLKKTFLKRHKFHIVCNIGHGFHLIKTYIDNRELQSIMFSLLDESITKTLIYNAKTTNMNDIHRLVNYFNDIFITIDKSTDEVQDNERITFEKLCQAMNEHVLVESSFVRVILFAIYVHLLRYECRLVFAADLPPIRPLTSKLKKSSSQQEVAKKHTKKSKVNPPDNNDDTSNSTNSEDLSRLHLHDHSSDLSRIVSTNPSKLMKNDKAISPSTQTIDNTKQSKSKYTSRHLMPRYYWIELYLDTNDDGYVPINVYTSKINSTIDFEEKIQFPMLYAWAFDIDLSSPYVKDVTKRYSKNWLTSSYLKSHIEHKTNGDPKWYTKLMTIYHPKDIDKSNRCKLENQQIENQLATQPVPQSLAELIRHPLYVLKSKLLKFEGIYPNDTQPVQWFKGEPIYPRENIHILRSKQTWLKEARQVNSDEEPYKIVEGRIKNIDRKMGVTTRPKLELFGEWQTIDYVPPVAKDGIVPCNEYGNVDLFKPEMIPHGCIHIVEPNATRLCKKLGINYAEAITGFDAHGSGSHPIIEGIVICKEFEQSLRDAIEQQRQIDLEKEIKKKEERIYKNWKRLIRGLIIKSNLAKRYARDNKHAGELATDANYQVPKLTEDNHDDDENFM